MKRVLIGVLALLLALSAGVPTAYAARYECRQDRVQACIRDAACGQNGNCASECDFVDSDEDGVCDNCENRCAGCGDMRDDNCDGICDNCGTCSHYADENGDGVCDFQEACQNKNGSKVCVRQEVCQNKNGSGHCASTGRKSGHHGARH